MIKAEIFAWLKILLYLLYVVLLYILLFIIYYITLYVTFMYLQRAVYACEKKKQLQKIM